jgi:hypothetical protein
MLTKEQISKDNYHVDVMKNGQFSELLASWNTACVCSFQSFLFHKLHVSMEAGTKEQITKDNYRYCAPVKVKLAE